MKHNFKNPRSLEPKMGKAVAERTVLRTNESWRSLANRVARGNCALSARLEKKELSKLRNHIANASILMSGRHLQHGDIDQPKRNLDVFSNCSTASTSFLKYYLLLNGSGVGRCYDDDMMLVDWSLMPYIHCVISEKHPDFNHSVHESLDQAKHKYGSSEIIHYEVGDSREGWAQLVEYLEWITFQGTNFDKIVLADFSKVRPRGAKIKGMQNRPSSGPVPLMNAINAISTLKGSLIPKWKQAMYVDHYLAECVLVGGARRSARIAVKSWRDPDILDFIALKSKQFNGCVPLWSSNNSVSVDKTFWRDVHIEGSWAKKVYTAVIEAAYYDGTGEPGFVNVDRLEQSESGMSELINKFHHQTALGTKKYKITNGYEILRKIATVVHTKQYKMIPNPCLAANTRLLTKTGLKEIQTLKIGEEIWTGLRWSRLLNVWKTGIKPVYRFKMSNGAYIDATEDHRILSDGFKLEFSKADVIDRQENVPDYFGGDTENGYKAVLAGLLLGDGSKQKNGGTCAYLRIGEKDSEILDFIQKNIPESVEKEIVEDKHLLKLKWDFKDFELDYAPVWERNIPDYWRQASVQDIRLFLRGLFSANGCVNANGNRVELKTTCYQQAQDVLELLETLSIKSYITETKETFVQFDNGEYLCKKSYAVSTVNVKEFNLQIGFIQSYKKVNLEKKTGQTRPVEIYSYELLGEQEVWDFTVEADEHMGVVKGLLVSNCGEISLNMLGAYCVIADVVPFYTESQQEFEEACRLAARALMRVNLMPCVYEEEVRRTNRIGVGLTGIHEYAWTRFGFGFRDLLDEQRSLAFWYSLSGARDAVLNETRKYAAELGTVVPHSCLTIKPAGTTSKLFGLSEGAHLPSMKEYVRWVQFRADSPQVEKYRKLGYTIKTVKSYSGTVIIGFPTQPVICKLGMKEKLLTASEATPEEQFKWVQLLEKYWLGSVRSNQVSYTLKYDKKKVSFQRFYNLILEQMPQVKCISVMPFMDKTKYEYQPEQAVTLEEYDAYANSIKDENAGEIDEESLKCASGACPVEIKEKKNG